MISIKTYLIQLDSDNYGWSFLWNSTIHEIRKYTNKLEIITTVLPIISIETSENASELLKDIKGIKTIEEDTEGFLCDEIHDSHVKCDDCKNYIVTSCCGTNGKCAFKSCNDCPCGNCADCSDPEEYVEFGYRKGFIKKEE